MTTQFSTVEAAIAAFGQGEIVIVVDAEDRENEANERGGPATLVGRASHGALTAISRALLSKV